jgi:isocitrate dehydrogenase
LGESLKFLADVTGNEKARVLGRAVDVATQGVLDHDKSPKGRVGQTDNRDSHFYFALYWAQALAAQSESAELAAHFAPIAKALAENEAKIAKELIDAQGKAIDIGGYYWFDEALAYEALRPSPTLNAIIDGLRG